MKIYFLSVVFFGLVLSGCSKIGELDEFILGLLKKDKATKEKTSIVMKEAARESKTDLVLDNTGKVIVSQNGLSQISIPENWSIQKDLNDKAELQVSNSLQELYVIVLSESKLDFTEMSLHKHSQLTREVLLENIKAPDAVTSAPRQVTINGNSAVQYEIQASFENMNVVYLHTTVETKNNYHQILAWTLKSRFADSEAELQKVISSFTEIDQAS